MSVGGFSDDVASDVLYDTLQAMQASLDFPAFSAILLAGCMDQMYVLLVNDSCYRSTYSMFQKVFSQKS